MRVSRVRRALVAIGLVSTLAACGSDTNPPSADPAPSTTDPSSAQDESPTTTSTATAPVVSGTEPTSVIDAAELPPMELVASLGYPRDLLERGRVNLKMSRDDDTSLVIVDKQLVADHFTPAPVEERRTVVPPDGRVVALQTLFGDVDDCDGTDPVSAQLIGTFTYGDDRALNTAAIPVTDASTLDDIRLQRCTVQQLVADNDFELRNPVVDAETLSVDVVVTRRSGNQRLGFDSIKGTVLFGVTTDFEPGDPERVLEPDENETTIGLTIDVNRCDSHAIAETTRKYGIDLYVSVDGAESQRFEVPIGPITTDLETILKTCTARAGQ